MKHQLRRPRLFFRRIRRFVYTTILGGLVVVLPLTLLVLIIRFLFNSITTLIAPVKKLLSFPPGVNEFLVNLISLSLILAAFFFIGLLVQTRLGRGFFVGVEETLLTRLPLYRLIRDTVQQFLGQKKMPFREVVLVDVFSNPTRMLGFITDRTDTYITVFVPTGPNPTNGFIFHVKEEQIEYLKTKPEDAMRTIIGVGTGSAILFQ